MNKTQLIEQLKQPEDKVNSLLSAAAIAADLKDYTKDQLKTLQTIHQLVESGKAKTYKAAAELYRQQQEPTTETIEEKDAAIEVDQFIEKNAERAAEQCLSEFPEMADAVQDHYRAKFIKAFEYHMAKGLQDPEYQKRFEASMLGKDLGKSKLSSTTTSPIALPGSTSSSN